MSRAASAAQWSKLGSGGCRAPGGRYEKREIERGHADVDSCLKACESDEECTAIAFGTRRGVTYCHRMGGGPYTHSDGHEEFECHSRNVNCTLPSDAPGYDLEACRAVDRRPNAVPPCNVRCAEGHSGIPVIRCISHGSTFLLEGCAALSPEWVRHGWNDCTSLGAPLSIVLGSAVSLVDCQSRCEAHAGCVAVTYHGKSMRCEFFEQTPPPGHPGTASAEKPECWRMAPPSTGVSTRWPSGHGHTDGEHSDDGESDGWVVAVVFFGVLVFVGLLALTWMRKNRVMKRLANGEKISSSWVFVQSNPTMNSHGQPPPTKVGHAQDSGPAQAVKSRNPRTVKKTQRDQMSNVTRVEPFFSTEKENTGLRAAGAPESPPPSSHGSTSTKASTAGAGRSPASGRSPAGGRSPSGGRSPASIGRASAEPPPLPALPAFEHEMALGHASVTRHQRATSPATRPAPPMRSSMQGSSRYRVS